MNIKRTRGFSLFEVVIYIALLMLLAPGLSNATSALRRSLVLTETRSTLENEKLLILDQIETQQPIQALNTVSLDHLLVANESSTTPALQVDFQLSATTSQGEHLHVVTHRTIWPNI